MNYNPDCNYMDNVVLVQSLSKKYSVWRVVLVIIRITEYDKFPMQTIYINSKETAMPLWKIINARITCNKQLYQTMCIFYVAVYTIVYYAMLSYALLCFALLCYAILYYTNTILYYTVPHPQELYSPGALAFFEQRVFFLLKSIFFKPNVMHKLHQNSWLNVM